MTTGRSILFRIVGCAAILGLALAPAAAVQAKQKSEPAKGKVVEAITLDEIRSVLGTAGDLVSGVSDFSQGGNGEVIIAYRYYDADQENYETDFANEIAPEIQTLYKKFKSLDRVRFEVSANNPSAAPMWKPFTQFILDRKTIEELHWTGFVARYIVDQVLRNKIM